jgi:hypothetical protein
MSYKNYNTVVIMPYLSLNEELKFSNLRIWPYNKLKSKKIKDPKLLEHLNKILGMYTHINGGPIGNPAIITNSTYNFSNLYKTSLDKIEYLKQSFLIPSILKMNSWSFITSDNFMSFYQRFQTGNDGLATQDGAIHGISTGGYKIGGIKFQKPGYINLSTSPIDVEKAVLRALLESYRKLRSDERNSNVVNSLSTFFNSYKNSHDISRTSRILDLLMSFELLFGETGRTQFRKNILQHSYFKPLSEKKYPYPEIDTRTGATLRALNITLLEIWAEEFYKLRHKLIHGNSTSNKDFLFYDLNNNVKQHDPHFYIAVNVFIVCMLRKLSEIGYTEVPEYYITTNNSPLTKNISGITKELFKIEDKGLLSSLKGYEYVYNNGS